MIIIFSLAAIAALVLAYCIIRWWLEERKIQRKLKQMLQDPKIWDKVYAYEMYLLDYMDKEMKMGWLHAF